MIKESLIWLPLLLHWGQTVAQQKPEPRDGQEEGIVTLEPNQVETLDLDVVAIQRGKLTDTLRFPAEIEFDPMRVAHLTPRVEGIVRMVSYRLGDSVKKGEVLALLESRELGKAKSDYFAALARQGLRQEIYEREMRLWEKRISAEQDLLEAKQALAETRIAVRQAREALFALGVDDDFFKPLTGESEHVLNRYRMTMPFEGKIIEQHITLGEVLTRGSTAFVVADTSRVWVMARVTERDLSAVRIGLKGLATFNGLPTRTFSGKIDFIGAQIDRESRTAQIRLVLENPHDLLRAGMFGQVTVLVPNTKETKAYLIPKTALQRVKDGHVVFRQLEPGTYQMVSVTVVDQSTDFAEVTGRMEEGDLLVTGDTFILMSQASKDALAGDHDH